MHESTFQLTYGDQTLIAVGDLIASEVDFVRTPNAPQIAKPLRSSSARLFGGLNLTHTLSWSVRREFASIEEARGYEWQRMATLPEGGNDLVITDHGVTTTLIDCHLSSFRLTHVRGKGGIIVESVSAIGGALSTVGTAGAPDPLATPDAPTFIPVDAPAILADGDWNDQGVWQDEQPWND